MDPMTPFHSKPMTKPLLIFDMDGVLVDVGESYRETIARTVEHFTGGPVTRAQIQDLKNLGGWNDDWKLSHHMVAAAGVDVPFANVKEYFQSVFLGDGTNGLINRERWVAQPGLLEKLNQHFRFSVFTGRPRYEASLTLGRFAGGLNFDPIVTMEDVQNHKPAPDGLLQILSANPGCDTFYVGDTVDDARCARAANVPFIGIAAPANPRYLDLVFLFQEQRPYAVIDDINYLEEAFGS
jgi:HAD superfamily phosphatase